MVIKLLILSFFVFIWFYRMIHFWWKYEDPSNRAYKERPCASDEGLLCTWCLLEPLSILAIVVVFLRDAPVPPYGYIALGCIVLLTGAVIACYGRSCLRSSWANLGDITATKKPLITVGIYRYIRNPIYIGLVLMIIGRAITIGAFTQDSPLLIVVGLNFLIMSFKYHIEVLAEEKFLLERYGQEYESYCKTAGRYMPRLHLTIVQSKLSVSE